MKRKVLITIATAAAMILTLTACGVLEKDSTQNTGSGASTTIQTSEGTASSQSTSDQSTAADNSSSDAGVVVNQQGIADEESAGEIIPDEYADAAENDASSSDGWTGAYAGNEESVSIALLDESTISFSFAQSGISGTASVNGMQAVYNGDDHYVVVFNKNGDVLDVSVANEEDYDASESPLNGTYTKE